METITIPKETFGKLLSALLSYIKPEDEAFNETLLRVFDEVRQALQESALQRVADLGQEIEAGPVSMQPLTNKEISALFKAMNNDPRGAMFSPENWFTCGIATAEAAHGIKAKP